MQQVRGRSLPAQAARVGNGRAGRGWREVPGSFRCGRAVVTAEVAPAPIVRPAFLGRAIAAGERVTRLLEFAPPLATRITLGYAFVLTGWGKLGMLDNFEAYLASLGVPFASLQAPFIAGLELVGGVLLVLGLLTRVMSLSLLGTMIVAILTAERSAFFESWLPTGDVGPLDIAPYVFSLLLAWLVVRGAGAVSLDRLVFSRYRRPPETGPSGS